MSSNLENLEQNPKSWRGLNPQTVLLGLCRDLPEDTDRPTVELNEKRLEPAENRVRRNDRVVLQRYSKFERNNPADLEPVFSTRSKKCSNRWSPHYVTVVRRRMFLSFLEPLQNNRPANVAH